MTVVAPAGSASVPTWNGPSTDVGVFGVRGSAPVGTRLTLYCNVYGELVSAPKGTSRLWGYTNAGWLNDRFMLTGSTGPTVPACTGNVREPATGDRAPSSSIGPYAIIAGEPGVSVRRSPSPTEAVIGTLRHGDLVVISCHVDSAEVAPPPGAAAASGRWDRLAAGGWLPEVRVYPVLPESPVPTCGSG